MLHGEMITLYYPRFHSGSQRLYLQSWCFRQTADKTLRVASVGDLERIRISRHRLEKYVLLMCSNVFKVFIFEEKTQESNKKIRDPGWKPFVV